MSASRKDASLSKKGGYAALNIQFRGGRADGGKYHGKRGENSRYRRYGKACGRTTVVKRPRVLSEVFSSYCVVLSKVEGCVSVERLMYMYIHVHVRSHILTLSHSYTPSFSPRWWPRRPAKSGEGVDSANAHSCGPTQSAQ